MELFNAWSLARASLVSYRPKSVVTRTVEEWGLKDVKTFGYDSDDTEDFKLTQAYVAWNDEIVVVTFRGTETPQDWVNNANALFVRDGPFGSSVHSGFRYALHEPYGDTTLIERLMKEAEELGEEGRRAVYVTGHSLGAALATLAAAYFLDGGVAMTGMYTFGAPRVGDSVFAREFNKRGRAKAHRFVKQQDLIARMPGMRFGFRHAGEMWYISGEEVLSNPPWWRQAYDFLRITPDGKLDVAADHDLEEGYIPILEFLSSD